MAIVFDPPGFADDLDAAQKQAWNDFISDEMDNAAAGDPNLPNNSPRPQFFNSAKKPLGPDAASEDVKWTAFPRVIELSSASDIIRWRRADASRDVQDEYCEWSVTRDATTGKITRIDFTCEGPEYWAFLAGVNPDRVLELYRLHVSPNVQRSDLFDAAGNYLRRNRWNNSTAFGVMHLIQRNNSLGAEIEIAGVATIQRARADGTLKTDSQELILCGRYGAAQRHSDPFIGARVNFHARARADVTLANPVGIYFAGLDTQGWVTPDATAASTFWSYSRGTQARPMRAVLQVPAGKSYVLGDVKIGGRAIEFGAQVADRIQMTIRATATRIGASTAVPVRGCVDAPGSGAGSGLKPDSGMTVAGAIAKTTGRATRI